MTSGGARRGRRDNGLVADSYAAAGDVDPRVGEHLLDVLASRGIAAYLQPATDLHPVTRTNILPSRPTDRLFVDAAHLQTARDYLIQLGPETVSDPEGGDLDELFAQIVAGYDDEVEGASWPAAEDLPAGSGSADSAGPASGPTLSGRAGTASITRPGAAPDSDQADAVDGDIVGPNDRAGLDRAGPDAASGGGPGTRDGRVPPPAGPARSEGSAGQGPVDRDTPAGGGSTGRGGGSDFGLARWSGPGRGPRDGDSSLLDGLDLFGAGLDDDEEDFTPPPPPPLPRFSPAAIAAVLAVIGGVVLLFDPQLLPIDNGAVLALGVCAVLVGFVTLVWRLRPGDEDDEDDPMGGAVV